MKESQVAHGLTGYFSLLWQLGVGKMTRTNSFKGMLLSYFDYQRLRQAIEGGGSRSECLALINKAQSVNTGEPGWPDYSGVLKRKEDGAGIFFGVEAKRSDGGIVSEEQTHMHKFIEGLGGRIVVARSMDDAAKVASEITGHKYNPRISDDDYDYSQIPF